MIQFHRPWDSFDPLPNSSPLQWLPLYHYYSIDLHIQSYDHHCRHGQWQRVQHPIVKIQFSFIGSPPLPRRRDTYCIVSSHLDTIVPITQLLYVSSNEKPQKKSITERKNKIYNTMKLNDRLLNEQCIAEGMKIKNFLEENYATVWLLKNLMRTKCFQEVKLTKKSKSMRYSFCWSLLVKCISCRQQIDGFYFLILSTSLTFDWWV